MNQLKDPLVRRMSAARNRFCAWPRLPSACRGHLRIGRWMPVVVVLVVCLCAGTEPRRLAAQDPSADGAGDTADTKDEKKKPEPPVYSPPKDAPAIMTIVDEKITAEEVTKFFKSKDYRRYRSALRSGDLNPTTRKLIQQGIRVRVLRMSLKSEKLNPYKRRRDLMREIRDAARQQSDKAVARQFREFVLGEVTRNCKLLLDNALPVRLNAVIILAHLNVIPPNPSKHILPVAYAPVADVLVGIISDRKQHVAVKIWAARGLWRVARFGDPRFKTRLSMASALIATLNDHNAHPWYQARLVEALGAVDQPLDRDGKPFIVRTLLQILLDARRPWIVRSAAAKALGRASLDRQTNVSVLATEVVNLGRKMADAYNSDLKAHRRKQDRQHNWKQCYLDLYLAFHYYNDLEKKHHDGLLEKVQQAPLAARHKNFVTGAYRQLLPMVNHVLNRDGIPIPPAILTPVSGWLKTNSKGTLQVHPGLPPITNTQQAFPVASPAG